MYNDVRKDLSMIFQKYSDTKCNCNESTRLSSLAKFAACWIVLIFEANDV